MRRFICILGCIAVSICEAGPIGFRGNLIDGEVMEFPNGSSKPSACRILSSKSGERYVLAQFVPVTSGNKFYEVALFRLYDDSWLLVHYGRFTGISESVVFDSRKSEIIISGQMSSTVWALGQDKSIIERPVKVDQVVRILECQDGQDGSQSSTIDKTDP